VLVEAAWHAARAPGPLRAFHARVAGRRGGNIATVAVARKLAVIAWHMLSRGEDYAFARPSLTREKLRRLELMTGAEHQKGKRIGFFATKEQHDLDKQLAAQAELAYRRLVKDWQPAIKGAGAAPGRASRRPSSGQAARQETAPPLRFSSRSPAPTPTLAKEPPAVQPLDFHP
jgi:transposase